MCDAEINLVAWLDGELPAEAAESARRHLETCAECRGQVATFRRISEEVDLYCDAVVATSSRLSVPRWAVPILALATAAAILLFVALPRTRVGPPPALTPKVANAAAIAADTTTKIPVQNVAAWSVQQKTTHFRHSATPRGQIFGAEAAKWQPSETTVQIALPAEAMFPPGAMPKGLNFVAELSIAPDGSVRQVRLRQ